MRALLLGSGGRESALAWALHGSSSVDDLVVAPGNPGIARIARTAGVDPTDARSVVKLASEIDADLVVIGPEAPLVAGVGDALRTEGRCVFGPSASAARIEGSKTFAKDLMDRTEIPTARWGAFTDVHKAVAFMDELGPPYVTKADGLAAGKGVVVTQERVAALEAIQECLVHGKFGASGRSVVVEEFLSGEEVSLIALTDGETVRACEPAQDYKRALEDDRGPNTGGMGSYSPVPMCPEGLAQSVADEVIEPMVRATCAAAGPFIGAIYAGLVLTAQGTKVLEFNARFGDPETQALVPRLISDFGEVCMACAHGRLSEIELEWRADKCVSIVLAAGGYPGGHAKGIEITGVEAAARCEGVQIFHAGTATQDGKLVTNGGRVLNVSALGATFEQARSRAYEAAALIHFEGKQLRSDIALKAERLERAEAQ